MGRGRKPRYQTEVASLCNESGWAIERQCDTNRRRKKGKGRRVQAQNDNSYSLVRWHNGVFSLRFFRTISEMEIYWVGVTLRDRKKARKLTVGTVAVDFFLPPSRC